MRVTVQVDLNQIAEMGKKSAKIREVLQSSFDDVLTQVFIESQQLVPVRTGALKASGRLVKKPISDRTGFPETSVEYGDEMVTYAVYVHENLLDQHAYPTSAKYLEIPLLRNRENLAKTVQERLRVLFRS